MQAEGMVHALEITHSLLKPGGLLIDIHPNGKHPRVEVHRDGAVRLAGLVDDLDDFEDYFNADQALAEVNSRGLFLLEQEAFFSFGYHADTMTEMTDHIAAEWSSAVLSPETTARAEQLLGEPEEGKEIDIREPIRITCFRALTPASP